MPRLFRVPFFVFAAALLVASFGLAAPAAHAQITIGAGNPSSFSGGSSIYGWGKGTPSIYTFGEVITVPTGATSLSDFTFWLADIYGTTHNGNMPFKAYVYAWDGNAFKATGDPLFASGLLTVPTYNIRTPITINTGVTPVTARKQYVLFFTIVDMLQGLPDEAYVILGGVPDIPDGYREGYAVGSRGSTFASLTQPSWGDISGANDLKFSATFGTAAAAPEPSTLPLLGMGLVSGLGAFGASVVRRQKARNKQ